MKKIVTIIGARPQIIKAAALSRAIKTHFSGKITEVIVHTGQHYDQNMSQVFFDELGIPTPKYNLEVGSASHGKQTGAMIAGIEEVLVKEKPDFLVLYGDTNSTLAGSIAASKMHIPIVHIEAGLRSFNKSMPEEINRIMCDQVSTFLFSPTTTGIDNLAKEGFALDNIGPFSMDNPKVYHSGDVMFDNSLYFSELAEQKTSFLNQHALEKGKFILATIHRDNNTDQPDRLNGIFESLLAICKKDNIDIVLPLHPRTAKLLAVNLKGDLYQQITDCKQFKIIQPVSFLEMIALEKNCRMIMTDSGGVQKEAFFFKKPCIIFRHETEWTELVTCGSARIVDADSSKILAAYIYFTQQGNLLFPPIFGDGTSAEFICTELLETQLN